jgi:hypothetical protein
MLTETGQCDLAVLWCLFVDETHNSDGRHVSYLKNPAFRSLDPELHGILAKMVAKDMRSVKAIAKALILPRSTVYFDLPIAKISDGRNARQDRDAARTAWLRQALEASEARALVFFDPDNGLETPSVQRHSLKSGKYVFWDELRPFWQRGQSLLIYHHLNRTASVSKQTEVLRQRFIAQFPDARLVKYFLFRRGSCRHFWLVGQETHAESFRRTINSIAHSDWSEYFEVG